MLLVLVNILMLFIVIMIYEDGSPPGPGTEQDW